MATISSLISNPEVIGLKIDGLEVNDEAVYDVELSDLDNEGYRNITNGELIRNRIRSRIYKISLSFDIAEIDRASNILKAIDKETFDVELFDIYTMKRETRKMYVGNRTFGYIVVQKGEFKYVVQALKFNLIEC